MSDEKIDISKMTGKELHDLEVQIAERRKAEKAEKQRLADLKRSYSLHLPEISETPITVNKVSIFSKILSDVKQSEDGILLTKESMIQRIMNVASTDASNLNLSEIYECPHCGATCALYAEKEYLGEKYGESRYGDYRITCQRCNWDAPRSISGYYAGEAWGEFHEWLIKKGFLANGTNLPKVTVLAERKKYLEEHPELYLKDYFEEYADQL